MHLKFYLYILIIFSNLIYAKSINSKQKPIPIALKQQIINDYKVALNYFKDKKYEKSYELFNNLFESNLNDPNINFYLGRSAFEIHKYHESIIAFERVLFEKPNSSRTKLEMGRAYFLSNSLNQAKSIFIDLKNDPNIPIVVLENIEKYLIAIDKKIKKHFLSGIFMAGINYDSNVGNTPLPHTFLGYTPTAEKSDWAHQEIAILNHQYMHNDKVTFKNAFMVFAKTMDKYSEEDIKMLSYIPSLQYKYDKQLTIDYTIISDILWKDDKRYSNSFGIMPKLNYLYNKDVELHGYFKYQIKKNKQNAEEDSKYTELNTAVKYFINPNLNYDLSLMYAQERRTQGARPDINKNISNIKLNSTIAINKSLSLAPFISYEQAKYNDKFTFPDLTEKYRTDNEYRLGMIGTYIYSPKWLYQVGGDYTKNNSNHYAYRYNKKTFTFNIMRLF